jgi:cytochrome c peroxidase
MTPPRVELGRRLFYDARLSGNGRQSCASCHQQQRAFSDGRPRAVGSTGERHPRSAMSLTNVAYNLTQGWADPDVATLEEQALIPLLGDEPVELGAREAELLSRLGGDPEYREMFRMAFPDAAGAITLDDVVRALASFERTLISGRSAYDRLLYADAPDALPPAALRGMRLFFSERVGCSRCHGGFNFSGPVRVEGRVPSEPAFVDTGLLDAPGGGSFPRTAPGLGAASGRPRDLGRFKVPTLRNVAVTAPYMHDGSLPTLSSVIDHYASGGRARTGLPSDVDPRVSGFSLTVTARSDLIAFLESLTDEAFLRDPCLADPAGGPPRPC